MLTLPRWRLAGVGVVLLLAARTAYLTVDYLLDGDTRRYHVEASATLFVLCGLALRFASSRLEPSHPRILELSKFARPGWSLVLLLLAAFALYWPALTVGWLSDDFVLLARASDWDIGAVTPALMRPVPLAMWAVLAAVGASPAAWHVLNVALHGVNAWLTAKLAAAWMRPAWHAAAGAVMLTAPLAPEAVAWASGVFDVSVTTMTLTAVMAARAATADPSRRRRVMLYATVLLALGCKETGAVAAVLVLIDAAIRRQISRRLLVDVAVLTALAAAFSLVRLVSAFGATAPPFSKYLVQRVIFESYGGLSVPWHANVLATASWIAALAAVLLVLLFAAFFAARRIEAPAFLPGAAAWILVAVLPVAPILFVAPDLQGSRYLYLAGPAWAALLCGVAARVPARLRPFAAAALAALIAVSAWGVRRHLEPWQAAGAAREAVLAAAAAERRLAGCRAISLAELPDTVDGAYVFRNGAPEAFARLGIDVQDAAPFECVFTWDAAVQRFVPH